MIRERAIPSVIRIRLFKIRIGGACVSGGANGVMRWWGTATSSIGVLVPTVPPQVRGRVVWGFVIIRHRGGREEARGGGGLDGHLGGSDVGAVGGWRC
jgi:hypothetical protein